VLFPKQVCKFLLLLRRKLAPGTGVSRVAWTNFVILARYTVEVYRISPNDLILGKVVFCCDATAIVLMLRGVSIDEANTNQD